MGIDFLPPDVNESLQNFAMITKASERGRIRFGLTAIKNVGTHICEVISQERKERGDYTGLENFLERIQDKDLNKRSLESLVKSGAMDCFGHDRGMLLANVDAILGFHKMRKETPGQQDTLFAGTSVTFDEKITLKAAPSATLEEKLVWEKELLGLYISSHPFEAYERMFRSTNVPLVSFADLEQHARDAWVIVGGVVDKVKKKITKKGAIMLFVTMQDQSGSMEVLVFPKVFEQTREFWREGASLCVVGKTPREEGDNKILAERAYALTPETCTQVAQQLGAFSDGTPSAPARSRVASEARQQKKQSGVFITLSADEAKQHGPALKELFQTVPGEYAVYIRVGQSLIQARARIAWNDDISAQVEEVVGRSRAEFVA